MKPFIHDNFLLQNKIAQQLFHEVAKELPVIDYHNHLIPMHLANNHRFENLTQLWISPDQYKHRAMRIHGIPEEGITGNASDKQKFIHWAHTFPHTLGNPLFHWSCLELKRIFDVEELLGKDNAEYIWQHCNARLQEEGFSTIELLKKWRVESLCTSDELLEDLQVHKEATRQQGIEVLPSLRGDSIIAIERPEFRNWLESLSNHTQISIQNLNAYQAAIQHKLDNFQQAGCQFADHALDAGFKFERTDQSSADALFRRHLSGATLSAEELLLLKSWLLVFLGSEYASRKWKLQLHVGAQRNTSTRLRNLVGGAGGYASIGKTAAIASLALYLDVLEQKGNLPHIVLYTLNPSDNEAFASLTGSFTENGVPGKVQFGPAWWYNDHYEGLRRQLTVLANYGLLHHFIGMTTDSRSLLSFSRHEYFRRVWCNLLGEWVEQGHMPGDWDLLTSITTAVCYKNVKNWIADNQTIHVTETIE